MLRRGRPRHSRDLVARGLLAQVESVMDAAKYMNGVEVLLVDGVPKAQLGGDSGHRTSAEWADRHYVRGSRLSEQLHRDKVVEDTLV